MKNWFNLSWLPESPSDFSLRCESPALTSGDWRRLSSFRLNDNQLRKLAKKTADIPRPEGFEPFRLGIISNANSDFLAPALKGSAIRHGVWLDVLATGMGQGPAAALNPESDLMAFRPDGVLIAYTPQILEGRQMPGNVVGATAVVNDLLEEISTIGKALSDRGILPIVQTIPHAPLSLFGNFDRQVAGTLRLMTDQFNAGIMNAGYPVIDIAVLAETAGIGAWYDPAQWYWAKVPFAQNLLPLYGDYVGRFIGALRGRSRKCLVLDLDNTLWGGVIGDDGVEGLELGQGSPLGEAYLNLQRWALGLRARGIVLAVCSKNDEETARLPFRLHPEQVLKEEHIAVFHANWNDKAGNIELIAKKLDIGLESLVFLDDNPAERDIVRRELPAVAVPEVPDTEPALWPAILSSAGYFEATQFTQEDRERADQYAANARRDTLRTKTRDLQDYLKALEMVMDISPFTSFNRERVTQLVNRSNQYNLTTRRYTKDQVARLAADPAVSTFAARLRDRFGDNGLISVVICRDEGADWLIDTWLMSCRVLGREVEKALLNCVAGQAIAAGKAGLRGTYIPSAKNKMVKDHYTKLGFSPADANGDEERSYLDLRKFRPFPVPITIEAGPDAVKGS